MSRQRIFSGVAHARAALLGNPSDGFGGRVIGLPVRNFAARAEVVAASGGADQLPTGGAGELAGAAARRFRKHCRERGITVPGPVAVRVSTDVPREVGLGGSSAIVIATIRALATHCVVDLAPAKLARLALAAETEELGVAAGLQDRVVQAYDCLVSMNFTPGAGDDFELLDPSLLPPLFIAYRRDAAQPSAAVHADLRRRADARQPLVIDTMREIAALAVRGREALLAGDRDELGRLMHANVELRGRVVELDPRHLRMVELAESLGAPANYAGSGGAIVGLAPAGGIDPLRAAFATEACHVIEPPAT